jgi:hypothetical protein
MDMASLATLDDVVQWMCDAFRATGTLPRADAAKEIERRFGSAFVYRNENGNQAIDKTVLAAFKSVTDDAVWDRCSLSWRHRAASGPAGKCKGNSRQPGTPANSR